MYTGINKTDIKSSSDKDLRFERILEAIDEVSLSFDKPPIDPLVWRSLLRDTGIHLADMSERDGGLGLTNYELLHLFVRFGKIDLNLRDVPGAGHGRVLLYSHSDYLKRFLIDELNSEGNFAILITEPGAGSDFKSLQTRATPTQGGYLLNGAKFFNARIAQSTWYVVLALVPGVDRNRLTFFLVKADHPQIEILQSETMGLHGTSHGGVNFYNAFVPASSRIGEEGGGFEIFKKHFIYWRIMQSAAAYGSALALFEATRLRLKTRHAFGGPIGRFTHLQQELAEKYIKLEAAGLLLDKYALHLDQRKATLVESCIIKSHVVDLAVEVADWALKVHGAAGYYSENGIEARLRDLLGLRIADGPSDTLRSQTARYLLGEEIYQTSLMPVTN